jgi:3-oxoacyl-[acyl-carrier protein] reductase
MALEEACKIFDLAGKAAIVTGGGSGIGRAVALALSRFGADVAVVDISQEAAEKVVDELKAQGTKAMAIKVDVTKKDEVGDMVENVISVFEKIDILVNCAGIMSTAAIASRSDEDLDRIFNVNFKGVVHCCQAVMEHMTDNESGKIVNIGSSISSLGSVANITGGGADYNSSKAAVQCFSRSLAWELAPDGVNVNVVAPGPTHTPMHQGMWEAAKDYYLKSVPAGRLAEPEDIADVVLFLCSEAARYIIGQTIHVNGGQFMAG